MSGSSWIIRRIAGSLIMLAAMMPFGQAMAACSLADAAGQWQAYSFGVQQGTQPYWVRCMLTIKPNGVIDYDSSTCTSSTGATTKTFGVLRLIGTQLCIFDGYIYLDGIRNNVSRATMNASKDHVDGVGMFPGGLFFFNLTKPMMSMATPGGGSGGTPSGGSGGFVCAGKRTCSQMSSCAEARFYAAQCGLADLDADRNGVPCESICR